MRYFERYELLVDRARVLVDDLDDLEAAILLLLQDLAKDVGQTAAKVNLGGRDRGVKRGRRRLPEVSAVLLITAEERILVAEEGRGVEVWRSFVLLSVWLTLIVMAMMALMAMMAMMLLVTLLTLSPFSLLFISALPFLLSSPIVGLFLFLAPPFSLLSFPFG